MIQVNALGDACPIPVVKTKNALRALNGAGAVETLVDNAIAVQNLTKMANQKGYGVKSEKLAENRFMVTMTIGEGDAQPEPIQDESCLVPPAGTLKNTVMVIGSDRMGEGSDDLGKTLMKGFIYAIGQQDTLPKTLLFYNGGVALACEESPCLEDLKSLQAQGVKILACGTCLNFYNLTDKLQVGEVTNMYTIAETMTLADLIVKP
jgi:selenium metabolism protein YedF